MKIFQLEGAEFELSSFFDVSPLGSIAKSSMNNRMWGSTKWALEFHLGF